MRLHVEGALPSGWTVTLGTISALVVLGFLLSHFAFVERGLAERPEVLAKLPDIARSTVAPQILVPANDGFATHCAVRRVAPVAGPRSRAWQRLARREARVVRRLR